MTLYLLLHLQPRTKVSAQLGLNHVATNKSNKKHEIYLVNFYMNISCGVRIFTRLYILHFNCLRNKE